MIIHTNFRKKQKQDIASEYYNEFILAINTKSTSEENKRIVDFKSYDELSAAINEKILSEKSKKIFDFQYHDEFFAALSTKYIPNDSPSKIAETKKQQVLSKCFAKIMSSDIDESNDNIINLSNLFDDKHYKAVIDTLGLVNADNTTKGQTLFSMATIIIKLSSDYMFGTNKNSPETLRKYGLWLMIKAYEADPKVFDVVEEGTNKNKMTEWKDRLLGLNGQFSCTGILSSIMIQHAKAHFSNVIGSILPPAWS
ncbi:hypothetical protein Rin_00020180 [Candidatus Regiella insecticola 5.15]|uniref:E3 ubiquitin-protein ligase SopA-like catalytic domain-containing protein n=1 Tax=Candidatus Regiella insecticola 5.15 TaxID=1005043 RepID=G2H1S4_9ENTR|nr:hypothetical protein [Candidatus Regiella insecticola]EGY28061.1 hypothetical protein Rin_00020180 [Candidatus Regiella insecticola 5.15]